MGSRQKEEKEEVPKDSKEEMKSGIQDLQAFHKARHAPLREILSAQAMPRILLFFKCKDART